MFLQHFWSLFWPQGKVINSLGGDIFVSPGFRLLRARPLGFVVSMILYGFLKFFVASLK